MDKKLKIGVVFGGMSTEHEVSKVSASYILYNLDKSKYEIYPIYLNEKGIWNKVLEMNKNIKIGDKIEKIEEIDNINRYLKNLDVIFPVLHGLYGEDGTIQGLFEMLKIPYIGCGVLASSVGMDKVYTKIIFEKANLKQVKYEYVRKFKEKYIYIDKNFDEEILNLDELANKLIDKIKFPMFIKPSNSGSSVGVNKAENILELKQNIEHASLFDKKILIEEGINAREIECAVLGNEEVVASCTGEVVSAEDFYSFDAKYKNNESRTVIPANIDGNIEAKIRKLAVKAFKAIDGKGLSRVDFFVEKNTNEIYINEINTLPGFTNISMYPKLFEKSGIQYSELLDKLIEKSLEK